jgi:N-acetyl-anhydromuramyl-L-alanine amidase AmpD
MITIILKAEALKFSKKLPDRSRTEYFMLHHMAGHGSVTDVHREHLLRNFSGIGYHFLVRLDGSTYIGRGLGKRGAHCDAKGMNNKAVGICAEGNFQIEEMPEVQRKGLIDLLYYLYAKYPNAEIIRHGDVEPTACPGQYYPYAEILKGVGEKLNLILPQVEGYSRVSNRFFMDVLGKFWKPAGVLKLAVEKGLKIWR